MSEAPHFSALRRFAVTAAGDRQEAYIAVVGIDESGGLVYVSFDLRVLLDLHHEVCSSLVSPLEQGAGSTVQVEL